jgi:hypothetical protein
MFIEKVNGSNYYLNNKGMGGFLNPPEQAEHNFSIIEKRGGHEVGSYSLTGAIKESWIPQEVKSIAKQYLNKYPGIITEDWIKEVYKYFRYCYSKDGINRSVSDCIIDKENKEPKKHLGYLFIKEFDNNHNVRTDLL